MDEALVSGRQKMDLFDIAAEEQAHVLVLRATGAAEASRRG
jgi:hypothetical protein